MARRQKVRYGPSRHQHAVLTCPDDVERPPVVVLLHGGFWRWPYGRWLMRRLVGDVVRRGWCAYDVEYRRLGRFGGGGGWPATFDDVSDALRWLVADRAATGETVRVAWDPERIVLFGHSAGAHLAVWAAASNVVPLRGVVAAAGPLDLERLAAGGSEPVAALVAGTDPARRWKLTSPMHMLPTGVPVACVHGTADSTVSPSTSTAYVVAARRAGDPAVEIPVAGDGHRDVLLPTSASWSASVAVIGEWFSAPSGSAVE